MKFIFVAPRFHTNHFPIVKYLLENHHIVEFHVIEKEFSEDYSFLEPTIIQASPLYKVIGKIFHFSSTFDRKFLFPSFSFLFKNLEKNSMLIIRNPHYVYSFIYALFGKITKGRIIIYTQDQLHSNQISFRIIYYKILVSLLHAHWITPVLGNVNEKKISRRIFYAPLAIKPMAVPEKAENGNKFKVIMVGKFLEWKKHDLLVMAVSEILEKGYDIHLTILGECTKPCHFVNLSKINSLLSKYSIEKFVSIILNVAHSKVFEYYRKADFFVLPSTNERFSISPLEAMSCALPVVISDSNGFRFNIIENYNGLLFNDRNLSDLVNKMLLLMDKKKLSIMRPQIIEYIKNNHSPKSYLDLIKNLYIQ